MGVVKSSERPRLRQIGLNILRPLQDPLLVRHPDGDRAVEFLVVRQVNPPKPPLAKPPDHAIAANRMRVAFPSRKS